MALTTSSVAAPASARARRSDVPSLTCAASAGTHAALVGPHLHESLPLALAFGGAALALGAAVLAEVLRPSRPVSAATAALLLGLALAYAASRSTGIPVLVERPEPLDAVGTPLALLEAVAAVLAVRHPNRRRHR